MSARGELDETAVDSAPEIEVDFQVHLNLNRLHFRWHGKFRSALFALRRMGGGHGNSVAKVHGRAQAEGCRALWKVWDDLRGGGARVGLRCRKPVGLGHEGRRGQAGARRQPVPDGRGPAQAQARERAAEEGERDAFKSERFLRHPWAAFVIRPIGPLELGRRHVVLRDARIQNLPV